MQKNVCFFWERKLNSGGSSISQTGGGAPSRGWGCQPIIWPRFFPKTALKWNKLHWEGARVPGAPLDPRMINVAQSRSNDTHSVKTCYLPVPQNRVLLKNKFYIWRSHYCTSLGKNFVTFQMSTKLSQVKFTSFEIAATRLQEEFFVVVRGPKRVI